MVYAATVDIGDAVELVIAGATAFELLVIGDVVVCGATHSVQTVLVLVDKMVERLVVFTTEVVPLATLVLVTGQLVTVV